MDICVLGPEGTYSHEAATLVATDLKAKYGKLIFSFKSWNVQVLETVFGESKSGRPCFGVVPIENSSEGMVKEVVNFWIENEDAPNALQVIGELQLSIEHCLLVHPTIVSIGDLTGIRSHTQALGQCRKNIAELGLDLPLMYESSTAAAAKAIALDSKHTIAAIASRFAAEAYDLKILRSGIQDSATNATRFHVLGSKRSEPTGTDRTALLFWAPNIPASLHNCLWPFSVGRIQLVTIHSIPLGSLGNIAFYCECDCHVDTKEGQKLLERMRTIANKIVVLGSYPQGVNYTKGGA